MAERDQALTEPTAVFAALAEILYSAADSAEVYSRDLFSGCRVDSRLRSRKPDAATGKHKRHGSGKRRDRRVCRRSRTCDWRGAVHRRPRHGGAAAGVRSSHSESVARVRSESSGRDTHSWLDGVPTDGRSSEVRCPQPLLRHSGSIHGNCCRPRDHVGIVCIRGRHRAEPRRGCRLAAARPGEQVAKSVRPSVC